jgi:hypothetical protein
MSFMFANDVKVSCGYCKIYIYINEQLEIWLEGMFRANTEGEFIQVHISVILRYDS